MRGELKRAGNHTHKIKIRGISVIKPQIPKVNVRISFAFAVVLKRRNSAGVVKERRDEGVGIHFQFTVGGRSTMTAVRMLIWHELPIETPPLRYGCEYGSGLSAGMVAERL